MKTTATIRIALVSTSLLFVACVSPAHLQKDFGESYTTAFTLQADLERESVADDAYPLSAEEAAKLSTTDEEGSSSGEGLLPLVVPTRD